MPGSPSDILKQYWGYETFRPLQEEIINSIMDGKDTLALLPTGGGKSICFQVPGLMKNGLCLVVSPLIALMKDQVEQLRKKGITAFAIYSGMNRKEVMNTLRVATESNCKFLYVSPERLETNLFKEYLPSLGVTLIAVDEAHCISQWGYDFRPPYLRIAVLRDELRGVPVLALTASATREVQQDICDKLQFKQPGIFRQSFERPALSYSVFNVDVKINKITNILQKVPGSGIVYCKSRRRTREISDLLNMHGIQADFYHAGLLHEERNEKQEAWMKDKTRTIVSTNAFGMGIDKAAVRTVIHADAPDCLENYYQEAGRAGRDGKKAYAVLLYTERELTDLQLLPAIHFPSLENIRIVYQSLMNYLQVASGTGEGNYYDFDITDFIKKFKLDSLLVVYSLKVMEQEELLSFNEQVFVPSKIAFTANKESLYDFEKNNLLLEPLIKILLRSYAGIFDQPVAVHEKTIAYLLRKEAPAVVSDLHRLHGFGIIQYIPQKDSPQLYFIHNHIRAETLQINQVNYRKRKEQYQKRIDVLLEYIKNDAYCRSQYIADYFGDENTKPCGICDNCLKQKHIHLSKEEFEHIHQQLIQIIGVNRVYSKDLLQQIPGTSREKTWKVINHLLAENKLQVDNMGMLKKK
jgi:ATP-dependent DNA helicase RecQ